MIDDLGRNFECCCGTTLPYTISTVEVCPICGRKWKIKRINRMAVTIDIEEVKMED